MRESDFEALSIEGRLEYILKVVAVRIESCIASEHFNCAGCGDVILDGRDCLNVEPHDYGFCPDEDCIEEWLWEQWQKRQRERDLLRLVVVPRLDTPPDTRGEKNAPIPYSID